MLEKSDRLDYEIETGREINLSGGGNQIFLRLIKRLHPRPLAGEGGGEGKKGNPPLAHTGPHLSLSRRERISNFNLGGKY